MNATPSFLRSPRTWLLAAAACAALGTAALQPALAQTTVNDTSGIKPAEIANLPMYAATAGDRPAMLLVPSVEYPTAGALYPESSGYTSNTEYLGYFNTAMCYEYNSGEKYFEITRKGDVPVNADGSLGGAKCGGDKEFSGNFLNWASGSTMDMMRLALTGGDRIVDTEDKTVLQRAYLPDRDSATAHCFFNNNQVFPAKKISLADAAGAVPVEMIEYAGTFGGTAYAEIHIGNMADRIYFGMDKVGDRDCVAAPQRYTLGSSASVIDVSNLPDTPNVSNSALRQLSAWQASGDNVPKGAQLLMTCDEGEVCNVGDKVHEVWYGSPYGTQNQCNKQCGGNQKPDFCQYCPNTGGGWEVAYVKGEFKCTNREGGAGNSLKPASGQGHRTHEDPTVIDRAPRICRVVRTKDDGAASGGTLNNDGFFYARVKVCDDKDVRDYKDSKGDDFGYCREYPSGHKKPVGVIQKYADEMRLGVFGYLMHHVNTRFGGVLRAPMKYVGHNTYSTTGQKTVGNDREEWDPDTGVFKENPEGDTKYGVSGVINYFNRFGNSRSGFGTPGTYKQHDPVGELYYEALRYMQGLPRSDAAVSGLTDAMEDGLPVYTDWTGRDPFDSELGYSATANYTCLNNSILLIGDVNTGDPIDQNKNTLRGSMKGEDADPSKNEINVHHWRKVVQSFETNGTETYTDGSGTKRPTLNPSPAITSEQLDNYHTGVEYLYTGGYHYGSKQFNSLIPGLAYWAHTHDIRGTDWVERDAQGEVVKGEDGKPKVNSKARPGLRLTTYAFDVNETAYETKYNKRIGKEGVEVNWWEGHRIYMGNQFWLGAKYGGFKTQPNGEDDKDYSATGNPFYQSTCTKDDDGNETCINGAASAAVWSDLKKAQGDNTDGAENPEPRTYYMPSNGRGVIAAFDEIFGATPPLKQRSIGGADSTGSLGGTSYQAEFDSTTWGGDVVAEEIVKENDDGTPVTKVEKWRAAERLKANKNRNIYMGKHSKTGGTSAFELAAGADSDLDAALTDASASAAERIAWLRGDQSKEAPNGPFRQRSSLLGDIVNSGVKYVGAPAGQVNLGAGYDAFVEAQTTRTAAVYVGANDGMLHAFHAGGKQRKDDGSLEEREGTGDELFAYIPSWMRGKLADLTSPKYKHQAYVDATPVIGDAVIAAAPQGSKEDWASVLVGGTGGGGKGVYALNVTEPSAFAADNVLWEFTDEDDPDMGYVLGQPRIVKLYFGQSEGTGGAKTDVYRWFALVPAGVNNYVGDEASTPAAGNGDANIFLLALDKAARAPWSKGSNYWKIRLPRIEALEKTHPTGILNLEAFTGLGGVTEYVYAGDLHGQLWAFSFKRAGANLWTDDEQWKLAAPYIAGSKKPKPLYIAEDKDGKAQPITVAPTILEGAGNGVHFVSFGTGKYFEPGDAYTTHLNTFYTVYSNFNSATSDFETHSGGAVIKGRTALEEVKLAPEDGVDYFKPDNSFFWGWVPSDEVGKRTRAGWFHDFDGSGEREVADATWISLTSRLMFSTLTPNAANETGICGAKGGDSKVYTFDMISGKGFRKVSTVGMLAQPLVFFDKPEETAADSTGRRLRISPVLSGQFGADGSSVQKVETVVVPFGRLSWRRIDNFQELRNEK